MIDHTQVGMSGAEFEHFFKSQFKIVNAKFDLLFESKDIYRLFKDRFILKHGRITKKSIG